MITELPEGHAGQKPRRLITGRSRGPAGRRWLFFFKAGRVAVKTDLHLTIQKLIPNPDALIDQEELRKPYQRAFLAAVGRHSCLPPGNAATLADRNVCPTHHSIGHLPPRGESCGLARGSGGRLLLAVVEPGKRPLVVDRQRVQGVSERDNLLRR